jgi:hypothetical protein
MGGGRWIHLRGRTRVVVAAYKVTGEPADGYKEGDETLYIKLAFHSGPGKCE